MKKTNKKSAVAKPVVSMAASPASPAIAPVIAPKVSVALTPPVAAPVKPAPAKSAIVTAAAPVTIEAKIDVGFGNRLFARGEGGGLSWERGTPLENVDSKTWRLIVPAKDKLQFKLLLNDSVWAQGEDVQAVPGKKVELTPAF